MYAKPKNFLNHTRTRAFFALSFIFCFLFSAASAACEETYSEQTGTYLGCRIPQGDRVLDSFWLSSLHNLYGGTLGREGVAWFTIDKKGRYHGRSLRRVAGKECLELDLQGWTGQLYKVGRGLYVAYNDVDTERGFYLFFVSDDYKTAHSNFLARHGMVDVAEINTHHRMRRKDFALENLLRIAQPHLCGDKE